jgi:hypothetical protein
MCFMDLNLLFITLNILAPISNISSITTNYNCLYWNVSLFNEFNDKFDKLNRDCWTSMFNVECIVKPSILKATSHIGAISKALVFVKSKDMSLLYNCSNSWIMSFNVKVLLDPVKDTNNHKNKSWRKSLSNFQTRNKTKLCNSKIRTQELRTKTWDV